MSVGRFNDVATELALDGIFDDFSHTCSSSQKDLFRLCNIFEFFVLMSII
jgi:hypothetical protein